MSNNSRPIVEFGKQLEWDDERKEYVPAPTVVESYFTHLREIHMSEEEWAEYIYYAQLGAVIDV